MKIINTLIAPPGAGKTTWLINHLDHNKHHRCIIAFPTKLLSTEVQSKLRTLNLKFDAIDSDTVEGSVTQCLETNLLHQNDQIIICTHESLRLIRPSTLQGWHVYIDEIPTTWDCETLTFTEISYQAVIAQYIDDSEAGSKRIKVKPTCKQLIHELATKHDTTISKEARKLFKSLLDQRYVIEVDPLDVKKNRTVRVIGVKDYIPAFEAAESTTIMGAEIDKSLLGVILRGAGWSNTPINAELDFRGYQNRVIIHPFLENKSYSKKIALMRGGKEYNEYQEDCLLDAWLRKDVLRLIGSKKAILVAHAWCTLPLPESSNITPIKIDSRGVNEYDDYSIAVCLQHGNITPIENRSIPTLADLLSKNRTIDAKDIREAIKYERFYESTLQSVCRTALRSRDHGDEILLFVQDQSIAKFLLDKIQDCIIDNTYSEVVVTEKSSAKINRESLQQQAVMLWKSGHEEEFIASQVRKTTKTIRNWLKPHKQLKAIQEG
ncbi:DEAD/DEAH box helicase family protein [Pseudomonas putida]|uniref:DEAD/DEAH box helicase family protein n=1 Tax=Pseudomonas putida TaxID=303 RepID=UPI002363E865|nr:DEAD/DEAH box helicase family protein [Pseudomonas putida]MDD2144689.1 DEAD/DEAH box helicase family protein [Pseudomonas putida]HDS1709061.1 DEAD/DEAH box helicase family protein [Pseudomonas putida]